MPTQEMPMHYVNREEWGARSPLGEIPPMELPIKYVRLVFTKDFKKCHSNRKCTKRMKQLQEDNMTVKNLPDIQPNFVVAGDGYVYEGRGWRFQPEKIPDRPDLDGKFAEFAFMGDYSEKPPNTEMLKRTWQATNCGIDYEFLAKDFEILDLGGPEYDNIGDDEPKFDE